MTYTFDANDRLLTVTNDAAGTVGDTHTVFTYDATEQSTKTVHAGLDDQGAVTSTTSYAYNLQGRMSRVELDIDGDAAVDTIIETTYNDQGIRVRETTTDVDTSTTTVREYVIDARNHTGYAQVLEEWVDGVLAKAYTIGLDVVAQVAAGAQGAVPAGTPLVLLYDGHGSTRALLDDAALPGGGFRG